MVHSSSSSNLGTMSGVEGAQGAAAVAFPDRGPTAFAVTTATLVLATVFVAARMFSRIRIVKHVTADDYIIVVAWLFAFFLSFTIDLGATRGLGRHDADISHDLRPELRKAEYAFSILYVCACIVYGLDSVLTCS